jgi:hypothetical protein
MKIGIAFEVQRMKCYIWSIALYGAGTETLQEIDPKCLYSSKCGIGEGWIRYVGTIGCNMK